MVDLFSLFFSTETITTTLIFGVLGVLFTILAFVMTLRNIILPMFSPKLIIFMWILAMSFWVIVFVNGFLEYVRQNQETIVIILVIILAYMVFTPKKFNNINKKKNGN